VYKAGKIAEAKDIAIKLNETKFVGIFLAKYGAPRRPVEPCTGWCSEFLTTCIRDLQTVYLLLYKPDV